jgi:hypothetical protein
MLDSLTATRFDRRITRGRTGPFLLEGERGDGDTVEVIAKFTSEQLTIEGLIRETFGALLAADLGLPVPACYCVALTPDFVASVTASHPAYGATLAKAVPVGFGSAKLPPGFTAWMPQRGLPRTMRQTAAEIYAFDLLIQNPDRRPDNPNLQSRGEEFAIFDHEMALMTEGILCWTPPWQVDSLAAAAPRHVLFSELRGTQPDLSRLIGAWEAVDDSRLQAYRAALPPEWTATAAAAQTADTGIGFLVDLRSNVRLAMQEIMRTLA